MATTSNNFCFIFLLVSSADRLISFFVCSLLYVLRQYFVHLIEWRISDAFGDVLVAHRLSGKEVCGFFEKKWNWNCLEMTVETTSFLSGAKITSNGSEKSAKFLKNHKNLIIFLLAIILLLFCVSASALQVPTDNFFMCFLFFFFVLASHANLLFIGVKNDFSFITIFFRAT